MSEVRLQAAVKQYDLTWQYYQQNRVDTRDVYLWSRLLLDARQAVEQGPRRSDPATARSTSST